MNSRYSVLNSGSVVTMVVSKFNIYPLWCQKSKSTLWSKLIKSNQHWSVLCAQLLSIYVFCCVERF